jgi:hypothetical protein
LNFGEVVERLRRVAADIASGSPDAPQPEIAVLDVSSCVSWQGVSSSGQLQ